MGDSHYQANIGIHTYGANAIFFVEVLEELPDGLVLIRNVTAGAKRKAAQKEAVVEAALVHPLLRGRDIARFSSRPSTAILFPYALDGEIVPERQMKRKYARAYEFLLGFRAHLASRSEYVRRKRKGEWYQIYCIYPNVFSRIKLCWSEVANGMQAAVTSPAACALSPDELIVADHTAVVVGVDSMEEADYLSGLLNSSMARTIVKGYIVGHPSPHVLKNVSVPRFSARDRLHRGLAELACKVRVKAMSSTLSPDHNINMAIDTAAAELWGISDKELKAIQSALQEMGG